MNRLFLWTGVAVLAVVAIWIWLSDPGVREQSLPDGSIVRLRGVTYGTRHLLVTGNLWQRTAGRVLPESLARRFGVQVLAHTNNTPVTVVWIDYERQSSTRRQMGRGSYRATPTIVSDGEGTEFEQVGASISQVGTNSLIEGFSFGAFPRTGRTIHVTVNPFDYVSNVSYQAKFSVPNPAYQPTETIKATDYPVRMVDDDLSFVLKTFHPIRRTGRGSDEAWMKTSYEIVDRLQPTNRWRVRSVSVLDGQGGSYWPSAQGGLPEVTRTNMEFRGGLSTNAPWTLRFQLANPAYSSNDLFIARDLPLPGRSDRPFEPVSATVHGVTIRVTGVRMKSYVYAELSRRDEDLHFELAKAVDDRQRSVPLGVTGNQGGTNFHFGLTIEPDATAIELTFALHRKRSVEIIARPQPAATAPD